MDKERFDRLHQRTTVIVEEGFRMFREGLREARRLISVTADATKLHIEKESRVLITHREYHRLGEELYRMIKAEGGDSPIKINETMRDIVRRIQSAEDEIVRSKDALQHLTVVCHHDDDAEAHAAPEEAPEGGSTVPRKVARRKPHAKHRQG
jgi:hypothetical protein